MTSLRCQLLLSTPRKAKSFVSIFYAIENVKSSMSVTCSSGEHVDRGTRWASRPRRSSLGNFRKSCWRWWWRFTLPGEQKKKKSLTKSVCLTSSFSLPTPEHKTLQDACHYTQCGSIFLILLHITPYLTSRCFYASWYPIYIHSKRKNLQPWFSSFAYALK